MDATSPPSSQSAIDSGPREWDLTEARRRFRLSNLTLAAGEVGLGLFLGLITVWIASTDGWSHSAVGWGIIGASFLAAAGCFGFAAIEAAPVATGVTVSGDRATFHYRSGNERVYRWHDTAMRMQFTDARFTRVVLDNEDQVFWKVKLNEGAFGLRASPLSEEAYVDLMTEATRQRCRISPADWAARNPTRHLVVVAGRAP